MSFGFPAYALMPHKHSISSLSASMHHYDSHFSHHRPVIALRSRNKPAYPAPPSQICLLVGRFSCQCHKPFNGTYGTFDMPKYFITVIFWKDGMKWNAREDIKSSVYLLSSVLIMTFELSRRVRCAAIRTIFYQICSMSHIKMYVSTGMQLYT